MPTKKKTTAKPETKPTKSVAKPEVEEPKVPANAVISATDLGLKFDKVNLIDRNDIFVGLTDETFYLNGTNYDGKEFFLIMFGDGQLFAVQKAFFRMIGQVMPK